MKSFWLLLVLAFAFGQVEILWADPDDQSQEKRSEFEQRSRTAEEHIKRYRQMAEHGSAGQAQATSTGEGDERGVLPDLSNRRVLSKPQHLGREDLKQAISTIREARTESEVLAAVYKLRPLGPVIERNESNRDFYDQNIIEVISTGKLATLSAAFAFLEISESRIYAKYLHGVMHPMTYTDLEAQEMLFKSLIIKGYSIKQIVTMVQGTRLEVEFPEALAQAGGLPSKMRGSLNLIFFLARIFFETAFKEGMISTYQEYMELANTIRPLFPASLDRSLRHLFHYVAPFVEEMSAAQEVFSLFNQVGHDPIELLAMLQAVLRAQEVKNTLSDTELSTFLIWIIHYAIKDDRKTLHLLENAHGFIPLHKHHSLATYEHWQRNGQAAQNAGELFVDDYLDVLAYHMTTLHNVDLSSVAKALKVSTVGLKASLLRRQLTAKKVDWLEFLPKPELKNTANRTLLSDCSQALARSTE